MELQSSKIIIILLLFTGESLSIYAEMVAAKTNSLKNQQSLQTFLKMLPLIVIGGSVLVAGYMLGFTSFKNIWIVSVASITSILIMEPFLAYTIFQQLPTKGAMIGFILGAIGFAATIFY